MARVLFALCLVAGAVRCAPHAPEDPYLPVIDLSVLRTVSLQDADFCGKVQHTAGEIGAAGAGAGFFYVSNHGVPATVVEELVGLSREFFKLSSEEKQAIRMELGGPAWRGYFAVGAEVTSGIPDQKEGIYFGTEPDADAGAGNGESQGKPLHGPNQWPPGDLGLRMRPAVLNYMREVRLMGQLLMRALYCSLGVGLGDGEGIERTGGGTGTAEATGATDAQFLDLFMQPTELFRIFNYPPHNFSFGENSQAVGEHSDYGYLTILYQDGAGGLQVRDTRSPDTQDELVGGRVAGWRDAPPLAGTFVVNLGDALEHATDGALRATPHRVVQRQGAVGDRLSMPYFLDPCFDCQMLKLGTRSRRGGGGIGGDLSDVAPGSGSSSKGDKATAVTEAVEVGAVVEVGVVREAVSAGTRYTRWDGADPTQLHSTYGEYLLEKVSKAFPELFRRHVKS